VNVLVLCDIHGNSDALEAVLADPRAAAPEAVVLAATPWLDRSPARCSTASTRSRCRVTTSVGNGERETAEAVEATAPPADDDLAAVTAAITAGQLGADSARTLGDVPLTVTLDNVLYCRATPRADDEMVTRASAPERYAEVLAGVDVPVVVAGHTHQQDDREVGAVRFVNAGSVGLPYEGDGTGCWLWVVDGVPELRRSPYDAVAACNRMLAAGWPDERSVCAALVDPVAPGVVTELFEKMVRD
jgi:hypothetical protein